MKLLSLRLLNFRRFREEEIIFRDDFSLVFGKNGSGKSSIIDAIGYALFGPTSKDFVRVNSSFLKSFFVTDRLPSKIELTFLYGLDTYKVVRVIDAGIKKFHTDFIPETKDSLTCSNGINIIGGSEVTNEIIKRIGISRDTFLRSVFARQKDIEVLAGMAQDRKKLINSILGLDKIENAITELKDNQKEKLNYLNFLKLKVEEVDIEVLKIESQEKNKELNIILGVLKEKNSEVEEINKNLSKTKEIYDKEDKKREEYNKLKSFLNLLENSLKETKFQKENIINSLKIIGEKEKYLEKNNFILEKEKNFSEELKNLLQIKNNFNQKKDLEKSVQEILKNLDALIAQINSISLNDITKELRDKDDNLKIEEKKLSELLQEKINLENNISYLRKEYEDIKKEYEDIKNLSGKATCPTCLRPLEEHYPNLLKLYEEKLLLKAKEGKDKKEVLIKVQANFQELENNISNLKKEISEFSQKEKDFIKLSSTRQSLENNLMDSNRRLVSFGEITYNEELHLKKENEYKEIKKEYLEYLKIEGEVRNKGKLEADLKTLAEKEENTGKDLEKNIKNLSNIDFKEENYLKLKEEYFSINILLKEKNEEIHGQNILKSKIEFEIKDLLAKIENNKKDTQNLKKTIDEIDYIKLKISILSDYIIYLLNHLKPRVEDLASEYFSIITDYKYNQITLDSEYNILIDGKNIDLFSGGERDLANLCLRLSLGQNLSSNRGNPINFLVLDEVLGSQDKDRQQNILINLKKLENKFSQIILISHVEEIKDLATNLIEVKQISKDESKVFFH